VGAREQNYAGTAILHNVAVGDMADLLLEDGALRDRLLAALKERYDLGQHDSALDPEKPWLLALHAELAQRVARLPAPYRLLDERRLAYWFDNLIKWATPPALPKAPRPKRQGVGKQDSERGGQPGRQEVE
jgi:hypothetical protein